MKNFKYILIIVLALALSLAVGCKPKNPDEPEIDWDSKTIFDVVEVKECYENVQYEYDEFKLSNLKIKIQYTDGMEREIPVTEDMLDAKDLAKLQKAGSPRIYITYIDANGNEYGFTYIVKLVDSSLLDEDLNKEGKYEAVIKAIRNQTTGLVDFIVDPASPVAAMQFAYTYDNSIMQLSEGTVNASLTGKGQVKIEDGKVTFAYTQSGSAITTETVLFSVKFNGDFRTSGLGVDSTFDNQVYTVSEEGYITLALTSVLYHASVK